MLVVCSLERKYNININTGNNIQILTGAKVNTKNLCPEVV